MNLEEWLYARVQPGEWLLYTGYAVFKKDGDFYSLITGDMNNVLEEDKPRLSKREWDEIEERMRGEE